MHLLLHMYLVRHDVTVKFTCSRYGANYKSNGETIKAALAVEGHPSLLTRDEILQF